MKTKNLSFFNMLKRMGFKTLFDCKEFYISIIIPLLLFYFFRYIGESQVNLFIKELLKLIISVDATILAIVITGLAILLSVTNFQFLKFLQKKNLYVAFFFPFYLASFLWGIHIVYSIFLFFLYYSSIVSYIGFYQFVFKILIYIWSFWFFYSLFNTVSLVGLIIKLGYKKIEFEEIIEKSKEQSPDSI